MFVHLWEVSVCKVEAVTEVFVHLWVGALSDRVLVIVVLSTVVIEVVLVIADVAFVPGLTVVTEVRVSVVVTSTSLTTMSGNPEWLLVRLILEILRNFVL